MITPVRFKFHVGVDHILCIKVVDEVNGACCDVWMWYLENCIAVYASVIFLWKIIKYKFVNVLPCCILSDTLTDCSHVLLSLSGSWHIKL